MKQTTTIQTSEAFKTLEVSRVPSGYYRKPPLCISDLSGRIDAIIYLFSKERQRSTLQKDDYVKFFNAKAQRQLAPQERTSKESPVPFDTLRERLN